MEPTTKKPRVEGSESAFPPPTAQTLFIRCSAMHSRGDLVNGFLYAHREALGMTEWYTREESEGGAEPGPRLVHDAPLETVFVRNSRKPFFLVEWRYPNAEERQRQTSTGPSGKEVDATTAEEMGEKSAKPTTASSSVSLPPVSEEALRGCGEVLLSLKDATYKDQPVAIALAQAGVTVEEERQKLRLRDAQKREEVARNRPGTEERRAVLQRKPGERAAMGASAPPSATTTTFVPRSVRKRQS